MPCRKYSRMGGVPQRRERRCFGCLSLSLSIPSSSWLSLLASWFCLLCLFVDDLCVTARDVSNGVTATLPSWEELDSRSLPVWYKRAKFGILLHNGLYNVPSVGCSDSEQFANRISKVDDNQHTCVRAYLNRNCPRGTCYPDLAHKYTCEFLNVNHWRDIFEAARARYVVMTTKHADGFALFNSGTSVNWNSVDLQPHRDLTGELSSALADSLVPETGDPIRFGILYSLYEWYHPAYLADKRADFKHRTFPTLKPLPDLKYQISRYRPSLVYVESGIEAPSDYFGSKAFLANFLYDTHHPRPLLEVVTNDRWGIDAIGKHGGVVHAYNHRHMPADDGSRYWENLVTLDRNSWGYRRNANLDNYRSIAEVIEMLVSTVACGGNMMLNVGITLDGRIDPIMEERLVQTGSWLEVNGRAIFDTHPWTVAHAEEPLTCYGSSGSGGSGGSGGGGGLTELDESSDGSRRSSTTPVWYTAKCLKQLEPEEEPCNDDDDDNVEYGTKTSVVYAILLGWPNDLLWLKKIPFQNPVVRLLERNGQVSAPLEVIQSPSEVEGIRVRLPSLSISQMPSSWAWALRIEEPASS